MITLGSETLSIKLGNGKKIELILTQIEVHFRKYFVLILLL